MNPKFFTVEEANALIPFLETTVERIIRNKQQYLWLQEEVSILRLIVDCGADKENTDAEVLNQKASALKSVDREIDKDDRPPHPVAFDLQGDKLRILIRNFAVAHRQCRQTVVLMQQSITALYEQRCGGGVATLVVDPHGSAGDREVICAC